VFVKNCLAKCIAVCLLSESSSSKNKIISLSKSVQAEIKSYQNKQTIGMVLS
jgi:hypothetical protein